MTEQTTAPTHNAKDILQEALDTIRATFWIQSSEFTFVTGTWIDADTGFHFEEWDTTEKAVVVTLDQNTIDNESFVNPKADNKTKITGVCSIGAIALANVTLYDEPLTTWEAIQDRDFETWKAGQALAMAILENDSNSYNSDRAGNIIASWNDKEGRTRDQVIDMFTKALASPLLAADEIYEVTKQGLYGPVFTGVFFASEQAATEFLAGDSPLREELLGTYGRQIEDYSVSHYVHDSMATA